MKNKYLFERAQHILEVWEMGNKNPEISEWTDHQREIINSLLAAQKLVLETPKS